MEKSLLKKWKLIWPNENGEISMSISSDINNEEEREEKRRALIMWKWKAWSALIFIEIINVSSEMKKTMSSIIVVPIIGLWQWYNADTIGWPEDQLIYQSWLCVCVLTWCYLCWSIDRGIFTILYHWYILTILWWPAYLQYKYTVTLFYDKLSMTIW